MSRSRERARGRSRTRNRLIERKVRGLAFLASQQAHAATPAVGQKRSADTSSGADAAGSLYNFKSVRSFVAEADACRAALRQRTATDGYGDATRPTDAADAISSAALSALADYSSDDEG